MYDFRKKLFFTSCDNWVIILIKERAVNTAERYKKVYDVDSLQKNEEYRNLMAYYYYSQGYLCLPLYFSDDNEKIKRLERLYPLKGYLWCIAYVSDYALDINGKKLNSPTKTISTPSYDTLLNWLKYYQNISTHNDVVTKSLAKECIRKWVEEHTDNKATDSRKFLLIYNNRSIVQDYELLKHTIEHLEKLHERNIYEVIVNDFY